jgi:hypothetical protein
VILRNTTNSEGTPHQLEVPENIKYNIHDGGISPPTTLEDIMRRFFTKLGSLFNNEKESVKSHMIGNIKSAILQQEIKE